MGEWSEASVTPPFIIKHDWPATVKTVLYMPPLNNYPLEAAPAGDHQGPENFQTTELPGASPRPKQYTTITGRLITWVHVKHFSTCFIVHTAGKTGRAGFLNSSGDFFWLDFPI